MAIKPGVVLVGLLLFFGITESLVAQMVVWPIDRTESDQANSRTGLAQADTTPIQLPLWDDFAGSEGLPNPAFWDPSADVLINGTLGIFPPSINVASFDGFTAAGTPHNPDAAQVAATDSLTSRRIDLSVVPLSQRSSVYLSFYWQIEGEGELPDSRDFLRVQYRNEEGNWITKWEVQGGSTENLGTFQQQLLSVDSAQYFHQNFQFRFQAFGNQTGAFDTWQIDYVYLNKNRDLSDVYSFDRTVTNLPTSIFGDYRAIPINQYQFNPSRYADSSEVSIFNLDNPNDRQPISFSSLILNSDNGQLIEATDEFNNLSFTESGQPTNSSISGQEKRFLRSRKPDQDLILAEIDAVLQQNPDSGQLILENRVILHSSDGNLIDSIFVGDDGQLDTTFFENIDLKVNDTVSSFFTLADYYAYDDGTAEFAAGVNQPGGTVAYQFVLDEPDALTDVEIHFPRNASATGSIEIFVWKRLTLNAEDILYRDNLSRAIILTPSINEFGTYPLQGSVSVSDTFYIGFQQLSENRLGIGFDKNTDTFNRVYFNVSGSWEQDSTLHGSLMIRPKFRNRVVTSAPERIVRPPVSIYPNPTRGVFQIEGEFDRVQLYDLWGREVPLLDLGPGQFQIDSQTPGIYILRASTPRGIETHKLLFQP